MSMHNRSAGNNPSIAYKDVRNQLLEQISMWAIAKCWPAAH